MLEPRYIRFHHEQPSKSGKTKIWAVSAKDDDFDLLGSIRWDSPWRQYSFFPAIPVKPNQLKFEKTCLRDIADFCEEQTKQQREKKKESE